MELWTSTAAGPGLSLFCRILLNLSIEIEASGLDLYIIGLRKGDPDLDRRMGEGDRSESLWRIITTEGGDLRRCRALAAALVGAAIL